MRLVADLLARLRSLFRGGRDDAETEEELRFHLEMESEKNVSAGMAPREARRQAGLRLGGVEAIREAVRDARGTRPLEDLVRDLGYALRGARQNPGFTLVAVLTLALGIGANTAVFTVVDNILFRPPPFPHVDRLVSIRDVNPVQGWTAEDDVAGSPGNFLDWRAQSRSFDHMIAWRNWFYSVAGPEGRNIIPEQIRGVRISPSFFSMLGVQATLGRTFRPEEEEPGRDRVVILTDGLWQRRYGGDPDIVGETLLIDGQSFTVIGVLPRGFYFLQPDFEMWMPFVVDEHFRGRDEHSVSVWARLVPGVSREAAQAELDTITRRLETAYPDTNEGWGAAIVPVHPPSRHAGTTRRALLVLLGAVGCVLLIACANVANLLLVRAGARRRELAVRAAVGASRGRLMRQLVAESGLLAALGGAGGLVLAGIGVRLLAPLVPLVSIYTHPSPPIDHRVLAFMTAAVLLTTLLFGLLPAIRTSRTETLRVAASPGRWSAGRALLVVELALSVMLLAGAALLIQSLWNLQRVDPGFRTDRLLTMQVWLPERKYPSPSRVRSFSDEMLQRVGSLPGVRNVATVNTRPFLGWFLGLDVDVPGYIPPETMEGLLLTYRVVSDRYFETLGAELVRGRTFSTADGPDGAAVAVVNEAAAARYWPEVEPIGRLLRPRFQPGPAPWVPDGRTDWFTVVGVVRDFREHQIEEPVVPVVYLSQRQNPSRLMNLIVSTQGPATGIANAVQREIRAVDGDLGIYDLKTMDAILSDIVALPRFNALLIWVFASLALALSAIGVHGVTSYIVTRRSREFAIRIAVGAHPADVFRMVALETARVGAAGILVGLAGSLLLARMIASVLYEVAATDATILIGASGAVWAVALAACCRPAWTAMRVDPMRVLRAD